MSRDGAEQLTQLRPWPRPRFSLFALFVFVTLACLVLAWLVQPVLVVATALFQVGSVSPALLNDGPPQFDEREFEIFRKMQITLLKSYFLLQAAIRDPAIASLPLLKSQTDPVEWLQKHLEVEFPQDGEVLAIKLRGTKEQANDLVQIVDAVAKAYKEEVILAAIQHRQAERDLKAKTVRKLREELVKIMHDLEQLNTEADGKIKDTADGKLRQMELDLLVEQWRALQRGVERDDIESQAPERVHQIQPAIVENHE